MLQTIEVFLVKFRDEEAKCKTLVRIGNSDNAAVAHKASIQNEICVCLCRGPKKQRGYLFAGASRKVIYSGRYYFTLRLDLAWLSFAMFNGYCRLRSAVYERLTQIGNKIWGYLCSL